MTKLDKLKTIGVSCSIVLLTGFNAHALGPKEKASVNAQSEKVVAVQIDKKLQKSDARKIMKDYLKSKDALKRLRIGDIEKVRDKWKVDILSVQRIRVLTSYVDAKTGEITFKR